MDPPSLQGVFSAFQKEYDLVIIDSPCLKSGKDAEALAAYADGICVVVNGRITRRHVLSKALQPLKEKKVNFLGVIINNRAFPILKFVYNRV